MSTFTEEILFLYTEFFFVYIKQTLVTLIGPVHARYSTSQSVKNTGQILFLQEMCTGPEHGAADWVKMRPKIEIGLEML